VGRRGARANKDNRGTRREHYNIVWSVAEASLAGEEQSRHCPRVRITYYERARRGFFGSEAVVSGAGVSAFLRALRPLEV
jgi:hypothetical protein